MKKRSDFKHYTIYNSKQPIDDKLMKFRERLNYFCQHVNANRRSFIHASRELLSLQDVLINYAIWTNKRASQYTMTQNLKYKSKTQEQLRALKLQRQIYLQFDFLQLKNRRASFSSKLIDQLKEKDIDGIQKIFYLMYKRNKCNQDLEYEDISRQQQNPNSYFQKYYLQPIDASNSKYLLCFKGIQKIPVQAGKHENQYAFEYFHVIQFIQVIEQNIEYECQIHNLMVYLKLTKSFHPKFIINQNQLFPAVQNYKSQISINQIKKNKYYKLNASLTQPAVYRKIIVNKIQIDHYSTLIQKFQILKNSHRFKFKKIEKQIVGKQSKKEIKKQVYKDRQIQEYFNGKSNIELKTAEKIIKNLQPNFIRKISLTNQQRQILIKNGNLIVVGRSGTGKTTCAIFRLFEIDYLTKIQEVNKIVIQDKTKDKCKLLLFQEIQSNRNVFLTFSPILIQQIKKQYDDMYYGVKEFHVQKCKCCSEIFTKRNIHFNEEDPIDKLKRIYQQQQNNVLSLILQDMKDYPAFLTIQTFIKRLDKTIERSFFNYDQEKTSKKNFRAIKHSYINEYNYLNQEIQKISTNHAVQVDYYFFVQHVWPNLPKYITKTTKQFNLITPSIVWSQIFSIIKGSIHSYTYPQGHISLKMYIEQKRNVFQNYEDDKIIQIKQTIFNIFKAYQIWCKTQKAYDLMDLVNHLLRQTQMFDCNVPKINYMFIDQVQDLTSATTFLLSKMVINNIFYCGDTAQAITKGIDFRFEDIKYMFNNQVCQNALSLQTPGDLISLTVNFRSHNQILQLSNSIISLLQQAFPKTINKMKNRKQISDLFGPKPNIIIDDTYGLFLLMNLICRSERYKIKSQKIRNQQIIQQKDNPHLNCQQIVIVRNQQQKINLPNFLKQGIVLTPQACKGLQYEQIILYNFFQSSPCFKKWKILDYIDVQFYYQNAKQFEQNLSKRIVEENSKAKKQLTLQQRLKLGYDPHKKQYLVHKIIKKQSFQQLNVNEFYQLSSELKILYTIITRARSNLIIFDTKIPKGLLRLWQKMNVVKTISTRNLEQCCRDIQNYIKQQDHIKYLIQEKYWMNQGQVMLFRKEYEEAKKCYNRINRISIVERIEAIQLEIKADNEMYKLQNQQKKIQGLNNNQRKIKLIKLESIKNEIKQQYILAGHLLKKNNRFKQASKLFQKGQQFREAKSCYLQINDDLNVGECCLKLNQFEEAETKFRKIKNMSKLVQCFTNAKYWKKLKILFQQNQKQLSTILKKQLVQSSLSNILNSLFQFQQAQNSNKNPKKSLQSIQYINNPNELDRQIQKIVIENKYWTTKKQLQILISKQQLYSQIYPKYQKVKQQIINFQYQLEIQRRQLVITEEKFQKIELQIEEIAQSIKNIHINYIKKDGQKELNQQQFTYQNKLKILSKQKISYFQKKIYLKKQYGNTIQTINLIKAKKEDLQSQLQRLKDKMNGQVNQFAKNQFKETLKYLKNKIKIIVQQNKQRVNKYNLLSNQNLPIAQDNQQVRSGYLDAYEYTEFDDDMSSASHILKMNIFQQNDSECLIGLPISQIQKLRIIGEVQKILSIFYPKIIDDIIESVEDKHHHLHIEQRIKYILKEKKYQCKIKLIQRCYNSNSVNSCLLMLDLQPEFIALSPKYILSKGLEYSDNYNHKRFIKKQQISNESQISKSMNSIQLFINNLNRQQLCHKIPKQSINATFYKQSIVNCIVPGFILQGFYKQILNLVTPSSMFKLAYLFSAYEKMIEGIYTIITQQTEKLKYRFLTEKQCSQFNFSIKQINIFTIQNIFYAFDECQLEPFLSKKCTYESEDIDDLALKKIINMVPDKLQQLNKDKEKIQKQINYLSNKLIQKQKQLLKIKKNSQKNIEQYKLELKQLKRALAVVQSQKNRKLNCLQQLQQEQWRSCQRQQQYKFALLQRQKLKRQITQLSHLIQNLKTQSNWEQIRNVERQLFYKQRQQANKQLKQKQSAQQYAWINQKINQFNWDITEKKGQIQNLKKWIEQVQFYLKHQESKIYQNLITQQIKQINDTIDDNKDKIPRILNIKNKQQLKKQIQNILIQQQQERRYIQKRQQKIIQTTAKIQKQSNIPENNIFLKKYLSNDLFFKEKSIYQLNKLSRVYNQILTNGINLEQHEQKQTSSQIICNIIILYLNLLFNQKFKNQEYIQNLSFYLSPNISSIYQQKAKLQKKLFSLKQKKLYIENILKKKNNEKNNEKKKYVQLISKVQQLQKELQLTNNELQQFISSHNQISKIHNFLQSIYKRTKLINHQNIRFMQILFGFFQCRIIQNCPQLQFMANQYIIVKSNSIVIQKMKEDPYINFCYYFDQERTTVLCCFEDVQRIILNFLDKQHELLYKTIPCLQYFTIKYQKTKKFVDKKMYGYKKHKSDINGFKSSILSCECKTNKKVVQNVYQNMYLENTLLLNIKTMRKQLLSFYFQNQFSQKQSYFFILHQLKELIFLEKLYIQMSEFNYNILVEINQKIEGLQKQAKKWMTKAKKQKDRSK